MFKFERKGYALSLFNKWRLVLQNYCVYQVRLDILELRYVLYENCVKACDLPLSKILFEKTNSTYTHKFGEISETTFVFYNFPFFLNFRND